jgi:murein DD-endopeptidase MepM/ murein hydrolase activator NlpD
MRLRRTMVALVLVALAPLAAVVDPGPALAATGDLREELDRTERERREAERELARIRALEGDARARHQLAERELAAAQAELSRVRSALAAAEAELAESEREAAVAETAFAEAAAEVAVAEDTHRAKVGQLESRLVATFKYGQASLIEVVAGSRGIDDVIVSTAMVGKVVDGDRQLVNDVADLLGELTVQREAAAALRAEADAQLARAARAAADLEVLAAEQTRVTADVTRARTVAAAALEELQADAKAVADHIEALARSSAEISRRLREAEGGDVGDVGSGWLRPVPGRVTSGYGNRTHPVYGTVRLHAGVDLAGATGTPIRASRGGTVAFVGWMSGYGQTVIVYHGDGLGTLYAHLSSFSVAQGTSIPQGTVVGGVGMTGTATGPHLHFEVRRNGTPQDPCGFIAC